MTQTNSSARAQWRSWAALCSATVAILIAAASPAAAKLRVAVSINDLGSIASSVGGDQVEIMAIARPNADPHRVEVLPSYMVRVSRAQLYLKVGLGLDQWADPIIDGSHNSKLLIVDCSNGVNVLEKPTGKVDASMGDVHPNGNPHYWLDPRNAAIVAQTIAEALSKADPQHAEMYASNATAFGAAATALHEKGKQIAAGLPTRDILTYHRSWSYFADAFGLNVVSTLEPIPGIPPTARHLQDLVGIIQERKVQVIIQEPYFSQDASQFLARQAPIRAVQASASCDDVTAGSWGKHLEDVLTRIASEKSAGASGM
jgi:zinc/manganese transport system substrate-binding protein